MNKLTLASLLLTVPLAAQVPQGWSVFGTFGSAGQKGLFLSHPRTPQLPTPILGLQGDLVLTGSSAVAIRPQDGALLVGERVATGASVDLHVIEIVGTTVARDASFSVGTGGSCCGEIAQLGMLPDGRIVVAATDIAAGPLSNYLTTSYGYQGIGLIDPSSGLVTSVPIANGAQIVDVFNGMAVAPDGQGVYVGTWGSTAGDIWYLPLPAGGTATLVASLPIGLSNMAFDNLGDLWVTVLDTAQPLWKVDVSTGTFVNVPCTAGQLNAIANEATAGTFGLASASRGIPPRSIFWLESDGTEHLLSTPGLATPSGIDVNPNPAAYGTPSTAVSEWRWELAPNPGGLPELGNANFSVTVGTGGTTPPNISVIPICAARLESPIRILGVDLWIDLSRMVASVPVAPLTRSTLSLPIPNNAALTGAALFLQSLHMEGNGGNQLAASSGLKLTIL